MMTPWENHGWHVPFYISARGIITGMVHFEEHAFTIEFDLLAGMLVVSVSDGREARFPLTAQRMDTFYEAVLGLLRSLGIQVSINPMPTEIPNAVRFDQDVRIREFDLEVARTYWSAMIQVHRVLQLFRTRFSGKISPIHLFWGSFDLAVTRFSGRDAPPHPGGAPRMNDAIAREAYSREVSSAGFWPNLGSPDGPCFYSYAYPQPAGYADRSAGPAEARFDTTLGEFILPYGAMRDAGDPDAILIDFLQSTYEAAADLSGWSREELERPDGALGRPPEGY